MLHSPISAHNEQNGTRLLDEIHQQCRELLGPNIEKISVLNAVIGQFFCAVQLSNGIGGMCSTLQNNTPSAIFSSAESLVQLPNHSPLRVCGDSASQALENLKSNHPIERALAIATLNALIETSWQLGGLPQDAEVVGADIFPLLNIRPDENVAMVGAFIPFIRTLAAQHQNLRVLELKASALGSEFMHYYAAPQSANTVIAEADVLIMTATTLLNDTADQLLRYASPQTRIAVIGPSTAMHPLPYTQRSVQLLGGARVSQHEKLLHMLSQGCSNRDIFAHCLNRITLKLA